MLFGTLFYCFFMLLSPSLMAQLVVEVSAPKIAGQKAIIKLTMKNELTNQIESARAAVFLTDDQGAMVGQNSRWIIGGQKNRHPLAPGSTDVFNFVVQANSPLTGTNWGVNLNFTRLAFSGGIQADIPPNVRISYPGQTGRSVVTNTTKLSIQKELKK